MPTRKVEETWPKVRPCRHPEHRPPTMRVFEPGLYEHECPSCGHVTRFRVPERSWAKYTVGRVFLAAIVLGLGGCVQGEMAACGEACARTFSRMVSYDVHGYRCSAPAPDDAGSPDAGAP